MERALDADAPRALQARPGAALRGRATAPSDKSISHRALILGALAEGATEIDGLLESEDVSATAAALRRMGAGVERLAPRRWRVYGRGGLAQPPRAIECGNAGTLARLLMGAAAGFPITVAFDGDASLRARPMERVIAPLEAMGARFDGRRLPLNLAGGGLRGVDVAPPVASAQVKSAILLAGLNARGATVVRERTPTRDHTERMLRAFGADVTVENEAVRLVPGGALRPTSVSVPGDPSSAAFPLAAALIAPGSEVRLEGVGLNARRTGLFDTLREMGADLAVEEAVEPRSGRGGEPVGDLAARTSPLRGVVVPPERAPSMIDEYPILAVAAAFARGATELRGIGELRVKESDRIALMARGLAACGVEVDERPDGLVVHGRGAPPRGGARVETGGDHRVAMAFLVLGLGAQRPVAVDRPEMIATSFPGFAALMRGLGAELEEI